MNYFGHLRSCGGSRRLMYIPPTWRA
jgi:hypothetical protein